MENKAWIPLVQTKGIQGGGVGEMKEPGNEFGWGGWALGVEWILFLHICRNTCVLLSCVPSEPQSRSVFSW